MSPAPTHRLHGLDHLRALMMWLGIVLHVGAMHTVAPSPLGWRDPQRTEWADLACAFIHAFRMPTFFMLGGFFVMLLLQTRGPKGLAEHRLARLGAPFAVFWVPVSMATGLLASLYMHRLVRGTWGVDMTLVNPPSGVPQGPNTIHLWFLWMLLGFCLLTAALATLDGLRPLFVAAAAFLVRMASNGWGCLVLTLPLVLAGFAYPNGVLVSSGLFFPPFAEWLHYGMFFAFGLAMYPHRDTLFEQLTRRWPAYAIGGALAFVATGALVRRHGHASDIAFAYGLTSWLWSLAAIGLALRFLSARSRWLGYLADSSYWVYLVHLPLTIAFGLVLMGLDWPALLKIALNITATTLVCLLSYARWVRATWVGQLLNGRRVLPAQAP